MSDEPPRTQSFFLATVAGSNGAHPRRALPEGVPAVASSRRLLRGAMPALYQEGDFGLRFLAALELLLDPVAALLDSRPAHFAAALAPRDALDLLAAWLGLELDESSPDDRRRTLVKLAPELARRRGTRAGLERALGAAFPHLPLRVEDRGAAKAVVEPSAAGKPPRRGFDVYCDAAIPEAEQAAIARLIEHMKPVHVPYRLRVRVADEKA